MTYSCSDGLILSGSAMISCLATGSLSTLPSCTGKVQSTIICTIIIHDCTNLNICL